MVSLLHFIMSLYCDIVKEDVQRERHLRHLRSQIQQKQGATYKQDRTSEGRPFTSSVETQMIYFSLDLLFISVGKFRM